MFEAPDDAGELVFADLLEAVALILAALYVVYYLGTVVAV